MTDGAADKTVYADEGVLYLKAKEDLVLYAGDAEYARIKSDGTGTGLLGGLDAGVVVGAGYVGGWPTNRRS